MELTIVDREESEMSTDATSLAIGIDAGPHGAIIDVAPAGTTTATATSLVRSTGVSVASEGVPSSVEDVFSDEGLADLSIGSTSRSVGIEGGKHADVANLAGTTTSTSSATARQTNVNVGVAVFDVFIPTPGIELAGAGTQASAAAAGVETASGDDAVEHAGHLTASAASTATATAIRWSASPRASPRRASTGARA